mmetsp:Transcript_6385/g.12261  ORF Transcript_6385/g.12261 Transcript_6385/m.12261 type:complete len:379 (-) Transcript_6385:2067-3203(-)
MATKHQLTAPAIGITCHAWNGDRSMIAVCPNNNEIHIYGNCAAEKWEKLHVLPEHDLVVSGIDWSPVHNKIVSCSHDRNAFVWTFDSATSKWMPALVILRIDRAALDVKWSLDGMRFAVASGAKCVPVCTYEETNDWWVSKHLKKKFKSTVLCCAFHPHNGQLLATGSSDFKCRVYSTFDSMVDASPDAGHFGKPLEFGEAYCELNAHGWVTAVAWSPSGNTLCFAGHDSSLHIASLSAETGAMMPHQVVRFRELPLTCLTFISEKAVVGAGHDFNPLVFTTSGDGEWSFLDKLEKKKEEAVKESSSGFAASRALFQNKTTRGQEAKSEGDSLWTTHEGTVSDICLHSPGKISTSALDGKVVMWALPELHISMASLGI